MRLGAALDMDLANKLPEIRRFVAAAEPFFAANRVAPAMAQRMILVIDELLTNVISYAWPQGGDHTIELRMRIEDGRVEMELRDDGVPFNPLEVVAPALDTPLENWPIGGLGLHFVRSLMDRVDYRREGGTNMIAMTKTLGGDSRMGGEI